MNFLKDKYLAKGINHVSGIANFLVLVAGALAGGFIYAREKYGGSGGIYLLSDFAIVATERFPSWSLCRRPARCRSASWS